MKHLKKNQYVPGPCIPILHFHIKSACSLTSIYQAAGGFFILSFFEPWMVCTFEPPPPFTPGAYRAPYDISMMFFIQSRNIRCWFKSFIFLSFQKICPSAIPAQRSPLSLPHCVPSAFSGLPASCIHRSSILHCFSLW